jgi:hypothetical protein
MTRARRVFGLGLLGIGLALLALPRRAGADSPVIQGWWTVRTISIDVPIPTLVPDVTIPSQDVPDGGSDVAGTEARPLGILTLRYEFPEGSTVGSLVLQTSDDLPATPGTALFVCPLAGDGTFEIKPGGGSIADAPPTDCTRRADGVFDEAAGTWTFDVADFVDGDHLAVAVLPAAGRAVFERVRGDSLVVDRPAVEPAGPRPTSAPSPTTTSPAAPPPAGTPPQVTPRPPPPQPPLTPSTSTTAAGDRSTAVVPYDGGAEGPGSATVGALLVVAGAGVTWKRGRSTVLALPGAGASARAAP